MASVASFPKRSGLIRSLFVLCAVSLALGACGTSGSGGTGVSPLVFVNVPAVAPQGVAIAPPLQVQIFDIWGNLDVGLVGNVTLSLASAPVGGSLGGTLVAPFVAGVATFNNVIMGGSGAGYVLRASSPGILPVLSAAFSVSALPTQLVITSAIPVGLAPYTSFDVTVELRNAGNVLVPATNPVTLVLSGGGNDVFWHASGNGTVVTEIVDPVTDTVVRNIPYNHPTQGEVFSAMFDDALQLLRLGNIANTHLICEPSTGDVVRYRDADGLGPDDAKGLAFDDNGVLHACSPFQNLHWTIDLVSGEDTIVAPFTVPGFTLTGMTGMARHPLSGVIYGVAKLAAVAGRVLVTVDLATGACAQVGNMGDNFSSLTFDPTGVCFATTGNGAAVPETLFTVDLGTGAPTLAMTMGNGADGEVVTYVPRRLVGTRTVNAIGGVATFSDLSIDNIGTGYTLTATSPGLTDSVQTPIDVAGLAPVGGTIGFEFAGNVVSEAVMGGNLILTLVIDAPQTHNIPVFITIDTGSTATVGGANPDTLQPGAFQVLFPAGATSTTFAVPIVDDLDVEADETIVMTIRSAVLAAGVGPNPTITVTIQSND